MGTAIAGNNTIIYLGGAPVGMVDEPMGIRGSGYWVSSSSKRVLDPAAPVVVKDGGTPVNPSDYTLDYLTSVVTFITPPSGAVTITADYIPMFEVATAYSLNYVRTRADLDSTAFNNTGMARTLGIADVSGSIEQFQLSHNLIDPGATYSFVDLLDNATTTVLKIEPDGTPGTQHWAWVLLNQEEVSTTPDGRVENTINFVGDAKMGSKLFSVRLP